jgi:aminomethyltransferase
MPLPTPFHPVTSVLCESQEWREWSGYLSPITYDHTHEREYFAIRDSAALIDVSPLFKYDVFGPDSTRLVDRIFPRDVGGCAIGQIMYSPWCDDDGKVIDDGTVWRIEHEHYRITAADPSLRWFEDCGTNLEVQIEDVSDSIAAVALQGPKSREIMLRAAVAEHLERLSFYHLAQSEIGGSPVMVTRTGYTGDLGYEIWMDAHDAIPVWNQLMAAGSDYGIKPAGLAALDLARIEAGLLLIDVDYISSLKALTETRKSSPFELGLGWTVDLNSADFVGRRPLLREHKHGSKWSLVGLEVDWSDLDELYSSFDLAPQVAGRASRDPAPVYRDGVQVGQATSLAFSPLLKRLIALASVERPYASRGTPLELEMTVEYQRSIVSTRVARKPFYDPPHKRS